MSINLLAEKENHNIKKERSCFTKNTLSSLTFALQFFEIANVIKVSRYILT